MGATCPQLGWMVYSIRGLRTLTLVLYALLVLLQLHFSLLKRSLGSGTVRLGETAKLMSGQAHLGSCLSLSDCQTCVLPQKSHLRQLVAHRSVPNVILGMVSAVI